MYIKPEKYKSILHRGYNAHQVEKVTSGTRYNLILWCKENEESDDFIKEYKNKKCIYFKNNFIYTQSWSPNSSSESRMFVSKENINEPYVNYDKEYENQFYWYKFIRLFKYYPIFYEKLNFILDKGYNEIAIEEVRNVCMKSKENGNLL